MKPAHVWTLFAVCLGVVLVAMAWSSAIVLRLERAEVQSKAQAALEENARLALWRMDSALTPLLAQESARPYFHYRAFYAAGGPYARMFAEGGAAQALVPSPLLRETPDSVLLHFQLDPGGALTSPQVPAVPALRARALEERHTTEALLSEHTSRLRELGATVSPSEIATLLPQLEPRRPTPATRLATQPPPEAKLVQKFKNVKEFEARQQTLEMNRLRVVETEQTALTDGGGDVQEGAMTPLWSGESLLLARRVRVSGALYVQGCWVAWPRLQDELLASVGDLLPNARLEPVQRLQPTDAGAEDERSSSRGVAGADDDERRLAALPVRLIPGTVPGPEVSGLSPTRLSLAGAWICLLLAALSVGGLLGGVLALSERRRVFVSAVTHELRTPLTTFRLYTDMLAEGMVPTEEKRREYLDRLRGEGERLGHLVENVLFYSRLESGRAGGTRETLDVGDALERARPLLFDRATRAGLRLSITRRTEDRVPVHVDVSALEQVVVNLVDNACKYAPASEPPVIELEVDRDQGRALVRVRDHGPGLSKTDRRRLFRPFSKSDREAANEGPGVGLGLALSRRLMRAQGGDLALDASVKDGAAFVITLPVAK
jgi:signal transduction histidine kinase